MSSETIEGEPSYLEAIPIFSPSMPILDVSSKHISKPILDPDDPSYALSPETHDYPRNPPRHPKHGSHEGHKDDQEEKVLIAKSQSLKSQDLAINPEPSIP